MFKLIFCTKNMIFKLQESHAKAAKDALYGAVPNADKAIAQVYDEFNNGIRLLGKPDIMSGYGQNLSCFYK